jgi:hypothetical protein
VFLKAFDAFFRAMPTPRGISCELEISCGTCFLHGGGQQILDSGDRDVTYIRNTFDYILPDA